MKKTFCNNFQQEIPAKLIEKRQKVVENFKQLQSATDPILKIFTNPELTKQIQSSRDSKQLLVSTL